MLSCQATPLLPSAGRKQPAPGKAAQVLVPASCSPGQHISRGLSRRLLSAPGSTSPRRPQQRAPPAAGNPTASNNIVCLCAAAGQVCGIKGAHARHMQHTVHIQVPCAARRPPARQAAWHCMSHAGQRSTWDGAGVRPALLPAPKECCESVTRQRCGRSMALALKDSFLLLHGPVCMWADPG